MFLSSRELVRWLDENGSDLSIMFVPFVPPLWWWLCLIYSGLCPLPKCWREGIPQQPDLKGD